jgi:hypothetical protein
VVAFPNSKIEGVMQQGYFLLAAQTVTAPQRKTELYRCFVMMGYLQEWKAALLVLSGIVLTLALVLWKFAPNWHERKRRFGQSLALAFWFTIVGYSAITWLDTIFHNTHQDFVKTSLWLIAALVILFATFVLEGLEMAYSELRDKDEHQFKGKAANVFSRITKLGGATAKRPAEKGESEQELERYERDRRGGAFFEAREWSIVLLLVVATLMLDSDRYWAPWIAYVDEADGHIGRIVRVAITVILTTFPFVWMAQSPGKYVARQNSVEFLSYRFTDLTILMLEGIWWAMRKVGLQFPAEETDRLALKTLKNCNRARNLLPSEFSFFADGLKKYGYGSLMAEDTLEIHDDGSCKIKTRNLAYIELRRQKLRWIRTFEEGFVDRTVRDLERRVSIKFWAFEAPLIGERVDASLMSLWQSLFYAKEPAEWHKEGYRPIDTEDWLVVTELYPEAKPTEEERKKLKEAKKRFEQKLMVSLDMRASLPFQPGDVGERNAMLVLWENDAKTEQGTVELPPAGTSTTTYPYFKSYANPCLRSRTTLTFDQDSAFRFVGNKRFEVTYEQVVHEGETQKLRDKYENSAPPASGEAGSAKYDTGRFSYEINSPLPAAVYNVTVEIGRKNTREDPPNPEPF